MSNKKGYTTKLMGAYDECVIYTVAKLLYIGMIDLALHEERSPQRDDDNDCFAGCSSRSPCYLQLLEGHERIVRLFYSMLTIKRHNC